MTSIAQTTGLLSPSQNSSELAATFNANPLCQEATFQLFSVAREVSISFTERNTVF